MDTFAAGPPPANPTDILTSVLSSGRAGIALVCGGRSWTWVAFTARIRAAAGMLYGGGVRVGDRVALVGHPSPVFFEIALGCGPGPWPRFVGAPRR
ncbi:AMP-binding protein [Micromonospora andamanensis]|uniref:AMP-dependent synthetase/ligase domain-containing protein n=1 Tax=Micromonospora andamanensis TaxID=1287068 RepID=A0ABQ4I350_9ACTN|nr:AMP-binding protein [Micromonospora andamanensis]GIJ12296.1 hypothetical protein Van01_55100 [Micromonospora andamanensis]